MRMHAPIVTTFSPSSCDIKDISGLQELFESLLFPRWPWLWVAGWVRACSADRSLESLAHAKMHRVEGKKTFFPRCEEKIENLYFD
jgi:hypothetical protein